MTRWSADEMASVPDAVRELLRPGGPRIRPAVRTAWQPPDWSGLERWIPKAASADRDDNNAGIFHALDGGDFRAQEKLNGVFVLWSGKDLYTKSGNRIAAPELTDHWFPPGVALVGELFVGNGHVPFHMAVALARSQLPAADRLGAGAGAVDRPEAWRHARVVAFDVPGLSGVPDGNGPPSWPYQRRYTLLCDAVAAWTLFLRREDAALETTEPGLFPLQVIRQYPMSALPDLFRAVVEGRTHRTRANEYPGFGIPVAPGRPDEWLPPGPGMDTVFRSTDPPVPGEGLMIYRQSAPWIPRGDGNIRYAAVYKYKPTLLGVARVIAERPARNHPKRSRSLADDADASSHSLLVRWYDPWMRTEWRGKLWVDPSRDRTDLAPDAAVYFTFVFYNEGPISTSVVGRSLWRRPWSARYADRVAHRAGQAPVGRALPTGDAERCPPGSVWAVFPHHFTWDANAFARGLNDRGREMRVVPSPLITISADRRVGSTPSQYTARLVRRWNREAAAAENTAAAGARAAVRLHARGWFLPPAQGWPDGTVQPLSRALVCVCAVARAWVDRAAPATEDVWIGWGEGTRGPVKTHWGPFRLRALTPRASHGAHCAHGLLRVFLTVAAGAWRWIGVQWGSTALRGLARTQGPQFISELERTVEAFVTVVLRPAWNSRILGALYPPPQTTATVADDGSSERVGPRRSERLSDRSERPFDLFGHRTIAQPPSLWTAAEYVLVRIDPRAMQNGEAPWDCMWDTNEPPPGGGWELRAEELAERPGFKTAVRSLGLLFQCKPDAIFVDRETCLPVSLRSEQSVAIEPPPPAAPPSTNSRGDSSRTAALRRLSFLEGDPWAAATVPV